MIDCFLRDTFGVLHWPFLSTVVLCGARQQIHILNCWFLTGGFECDIAHRRCVVVLCMLYKF